VARMKQNLDSGFSLEQVKETAAEELTRPWAGFNPKRTRERLLARGGFAEEKLVRFLSRPLDVQWAYVHDTRGLWNRHRPELLAQLSPGPIPSLLGAALHDQMTVPHCCRRLALAINTCSIRTRTSSRFSSRPLNRAQAAYSMRVVRYPTSPPAHWITSLTRRRNRRP